MTSTPVPPLVPSTSSIQAQLLRPPSIQINSYIKPRSSKSFLPKSRSLAIRINNQLACSFGEQQVSVLRGNICAVKLCFGPPA